MPVDARRTLYGPTAGTAMALLLGASSLLLLFWLLAYADHGLDLTDEGFYLNWIANPWHYKASISQFGFVYHPLYLALQENIVWLRQCNILLVYVLAWRLAYRTTNAAASQTIRLALSASVAGVSLVFFRAWLLTPSYNSLAFTTLLLAATLLVQLSRRPDHIPNWLALGCTGAAVFLAKPSTAAALAFVALGYLSAVRIVTGKRLLAAGLASATMLVLSAWFIDGSIAVFATRIANALEDLRVLGGGHTADSMLRVDAFMLNRSGAMAWHFLALGIVPAALFVQHMHKLPLVILTGIALTAICIWAWQPGASPAWLGQRENAMLFTAICLGTWVLAAIRTASDLRLKYLPTAIMLASMPYIFTFGTNGNYWFGASNVAFFWVLSGLVLLQGTSSFKATLPVAALSHCLSLLILQNAIDHPYRQPQSLRTDTVATIAGPGRTELQLTPGFAAYVNTLRDVLADSPDKPLPALLDLTGRFPGAAFAAGSRAAVAPWLIGGYSGSNDLADRWLARASCADLHNTWILLEPDGPGQLAIDVLSRIDIDLQRDYALAETLESVRWSQHPVYHQTLMAPVQLKPCQTKK